MAVGEVTVGYIANHVETNGATLQNLIHKATTMSNVRQLMIVPPIGTAVVHVPSSERTF